MTGVPARVGVLGGGRMGAGIAHAFLLAGAEVVVLERDEAAASAALTAVRQHLERSAERGAVESADEVLPRARATSAVADLAGCGLVVEAVFEDLEVKAEVLGRVEAVLKPDAWLATNTSSISVDALARRIRRGDRLCGLHFFNPVPASALVEIVRGPRTPPELVDAARGWVEALGKTAVVVADAPGFASSRLGVAIALEAMRMLEEGVASPEDIDTAMRLGYRHPMGPLELTDLVGLDVRLGIAEYLAGELGERFAPPAILREKVRAGRLGRKTGEGFYTWPRWGGRHG